MYRIATALFLTFLLNAASASASSSDTPPIYKPAGIGLIAAAGLGSIDRDLTLALELSFRVGVFPRIELAAPFAVGILLVDAGPGSGIYFGAGFSDLWVTPKKDVLLPWTVALAGQAKMAAEASFHACVDLTGVEQNLDFKGKPAWIRGAIGLMVDWGQWLSVGIGVAYQRKAFSGSPPPYLPQAGWAGDSRVSFGAVHSQSFYQLPTLSVHLTKLLDIIALAKADINMDTKTTDARLMLGISIEKP